MIGERWSGSVTTFISPAMLCDSELQKSYSEIERERERGREREREMQSECTAKREVTAKSEVTFTASNQPNKLTGM